MSQSTSFIIGPALSQQHQHQVDVAEPIGGEEIVAKCTFSTLRDGGNVPSETTIWATGPAGTIAPSLHVLLSNYQTSAEDTCFVCSLANETYRWSFKSILKSYRAVSGLHDTFEFDCSSHGTHLVLLSHGIFLLSNDNDSGAPASVPASLAIKASTSPQDPYRAILLLYSQPGEGETLFREAFSVDDQKGCVFDGQVPIVCRREDWVEKISWKEVTRFLSNSKKPYPLMLMQSAGMKSDQCVTSLETLAHGLDGVVEVWIPGPPRKSFIPGSITGHICHYKPMH